jgi:hypothetical protein
MNDEYQNYVRVYNRDIRCVGKLGHKGECNPFSNPDPPSTTKPTPEFIWEMREKIGELRRVWSNFPSGASDCSQRQYAHYNQVSSLIDIISRSVELASDELKRGST